MAILKFHKGNFRVKEKPFSKKGFFLKILGASPALA